MARVEKEHFEDGQVLEAGDLNLAYTQLQLGTIAITDDNTAPGWISRAHLAGSNQCNSLFAYQNPTNSSTPYNSAVFTTLSDGITPATLGLGFIPEVNDVVRFQASGLVNTLEVVSTYSTNGADNYYIFRLVLNVTLGGSTSDIELGKWGYSLSDHSYNTYAGTDPDTHNTIQNQTFQFSTLWFNNIANRTVNNVRLEISVVNPSNTVRITRHQIQAHWARR